MPTLEEINKAAPETPVFVLDLYDCALLNRAALRALGIDETTPNPAGGLIAHDASGKPQGCLSPNRTPSFCIYISSAEALF